MHSPGMRLSHRTIADLPKTVLDSAANDPELRIAGEIDLSRDEDSVNTLVVGQKKASSTLVYAGINSSPDEVAKGKNEHFRVFSVSPAPSKGTRSEKEDTKGHSLKLAETSRTALLDHHEGDKDAYQRLLRVSHPFPSTKKQIGAVATGFAKQAQIALFEVGTTTTPKPKGVLEIPKEATDLDVIQTGDDSYQVAYCDDKELFTIDIEEGEVSGPNLAFKLVDEATGRPPTFKSIRYLAPGFVMALSNLPNNGGSILSAIRLPDQEGAEGRLANSAKLPRHFKKSTSLAVQNVNPPSAPGASLGNTSFIVVASSLESLSIWTLTHETIGPVGLLVDFLTITNLKDVHPLNITSLALSGVVPADSTKPDSKPKINLASVSMNNTVAIHSIPLKQVNKPSKSKGEEPPTPPRYAIALQGYIPGIPTLLLKVALLGLFVALLFQYVINFDVILGKLNLQERGQVVKTQTQVPTPEVLTGSEFISNLLNVPDLDDLYFLHEGDSAEEAKPKIQAAVHNADVHGPAKSWEDLSSEQKALWKKKLADAGHWSEKMGENVFKGIAFAEI